MRLTLRTLLAYLDDTLDAEQTRQIGQKVAESPVARDLIDRIRKATRRRRLANPPAAESGLSDPNTVAEYLDNELGAETLAEVEENCLSSDAHLAEIASCHQILTLVLTEPSRVPPTARQRMVELVRGPESIPGRRAPAAAIVSEPVEVGSPDPDEQVLGLPAFSREGSVWRQLAPLAGVGLLAIALIAAIWLALSGPQIEQVKPQAVALLPTETAKTPPEVTKPTDIKTTPEPTKVVVELTKPTETKPEPTKPATKPEATKPESTKKEPLETGPATPPNPERGKVGKYTTRDKVLLVKGRDGKGWARVKPDTFLSGTDTYVALPGYRSEVELNTGVRVVLWGNMPDLFDLPINEALQIPLYESSAQFNVPGPGYAADLTLLRGRVKLTNKTGDAEAKVRLRFGEEAWDVTLKGDNAEILADAIHAYPLDVPFHPEGKGDKPQTDISLAVLAGEASVKVGDRAAIALKAAPGKAGLLWNSKDQMPEVREVKAPSPLWSDKFSSRDESKVVIDGIQKGLETFSTMSSSSSVEVAIPKLLKEKSPFSNRLAVCFMAATDDVTGLVDALDDSNYPVWVTAISSLRHWQALRPENDLALAKVLSEQKGYDRYQSGAMLRMLHGFQDLSDPAVVDLLVDGLTSNKAGMRELAYEQLIRLDPEGANKVRYSPVADQEFRDRAASDWKKRLEAAKPR